MKRLLALCSLLVGPALLGAACTGAVSAPGGGKGDPMTGAGGTGSGAGGSGSTGGAGGSSSTGGAGGSGPAASPDSPGVLPLKRLTLDEYNHTVRDLLGQAAGASSKGFADDQESSQSGFVKGGAITSGTDARAFLTSAETVATAAVGNLAGLLPCKPLPTASADQDACAKQFITAFGKRAFRRPLADDEAADLFALYSAQRGADIGGTFADGIKIVIQGVLETPYFLYHWELGPNAAQKDGDLVRLDSFEIASRLSYFLWATMPDDKLFTAADANELQTPAQIAAQARRMLADPRAADAIQSFHFQWLEVMGLTEVEKDPALPSYSPQLMQSMLDETSAFVNSLLLGAKATGKLDDLFTSSASFADATLAKFYGAKAPTGTGAQPVSLDPTQRAGVFTQASFLSAHADAENSHPVKRGVAILNRVACQGIVLPPNLVVPPIPDPVAGQTTRQRFAMHGMNPCASCHRQIDPIGFSFEHYGALGGFRTTEENQTVDSTGSFPLGNKTITFKDAIDMSKQLVATDEVRSCMSKQWMRFLLGRQEGTGETTALASAMSAFAGSGFDIRELIVALTQTKAFTHRTPAAGEVLQ